MHISRVRSSSHVTRELVCAGNHHNAPAQYMRALFCTKIMRMHRKLPQYYLLLQRVDQVTTRLEMWL